MHRFHLPPDQCRGDALTLEGAEAHHALRVLRIREGERVAVLDGAGQILSCEVTGAAQRSLSLRAIERRTTPPPLSAITLIQAVPKGKIIENIIQKATELGAARIVPILSERVVTQISSEDAQARAEKWQHIAIEAIKQCGSPWLTKVEAPVPLDVFLTRTEKFELPLVGCLEPDSRHPREHFERFFSAQKRAPKAVAVWVGPEGDFTPDEYAAIKSSGAFPISLGPLVLRVETAAIYCLSIVSYELRAPVR